MMNAKNPSAISLKRRKFSSGSPVLFSGDLYAANDILLIGLAKAQIEVYNRIKSLRLDDSANAAIGFFSTAQAFSWEPVYTAMAEGVLPTEEPTEYGFTELEVSAFEDVDKKLLQLSSRLQAAKEEYERTRSPQALGRVQKLSAEFELIATAKVHRKVLRTIPSLPLTQDRLQREIESLLEQNTDDLERIRDLDYRVTAMQYEREFNAQVEKGFSDTLGYIAEQDMGNLNLSYEIAQRTGLASGEQIRDAFLSFSNLPSQNIANAMYGIAATAGPAIEECQAVQSQLAKQVARTSRLRSLLEVRAAKELKRKAVRLGHALAESMTDYEFTSGEAISPDDPTATTDVDVTKTLNVFNFQNPIFRAAIDGVADGMGLYAPALRGMFVASSQEINVTKVGLLLEERKQALGDMSLILQEGYERVFKNWDGDRDKLEQRIAPFVLVFSKKARKNLSNVMSAGEDLSDKETRQRVLNEIKNDVQGIVNDPEIADMRRKFLKERV